MPTLACVAVDGACRASSNKRRPCQGSPGFSLHKGLDASHSRRSAVRQTQRSVNFGYGALSKAWRSTSVAKLSLRRALGADHIGGSGDADDNASPGPASLKTQTIAASDSLPEDCDDIESDEDSSSSPASAEQQQRGLVSLRITVQGIPEQEPGQSGPMLVGDRKALGAWDSEKAVKMAVNGSGAWETDILVPPGPLEFKLFSNTPMGRISPKNCNWKLDVPASERLSKSAPGGFFIASCKCGIPEVCNVSVDTTTARRMAGRIQDAEQHMAGLRKRQEKLRSRLRSLSGKIQTTTERIGIIRGGVEEARQEAAAASSEVPAGAMDGDTRTRQELIDDLEAMYRNASWADSETQADATDVAAAGLGDHENDDDADEGAPPQPASAVGNTTQEGLKAAEEEEQVEIVEEQGEAAPQLQLDADLPVTVNPSSESAPEARPSAFARESHSTTGAHTTYVAGGAPAESKPAAPTAAASTAALGADADDVEKPKEAPVVEERALLEESMSKTKKEGHRFGAELPGVFLAACVIAAAQALMSVVSESKKHRAMP